MAADPRAPGLGSRFAQTGFRGGTRLHLLDSRQECGGSGFDAEPARVGGWGAMPTETRYSESALFGGFLDYLRLQGFPVGLDQFLRLQVLLEHLGGECGPSGLKSHLCPLFARNEEEQQRFY